MFDSPSGKPIELVYPRGILDSHVINSHGMVCVTSSCTSQRGSKLSSALGGALPYASLGRTSSVHNKALAPQQHWSPPGSVLQCQPPQQTSGRVRGPQPTVAHLFTDFRELAPRDGDSVTDRLARFEECLTHLETSADLPSSIAFALPSSRFDETAWRSAVAQFTARINKHASIRVSIVLQSSQFCHQLTQLSKFHSELSEIRSATKNAYHAALQAPTAYEQHVACALVQHIEEGLIESIHNCTQGLESPAVAATVQASHSFSNHDDSGELRVQTHSVDVAAAVTSLQNKATAALDAIFSTKNDVTRVDIDVSDDGWATLSFTPPTPRTRDVSDLPPAIAAYIADDFAFNSSCVTAGVASDSEYDAARDRIRRENDAINESYRAFLRESKSKGELTAASFADSYRHDVPSSNAKSSDSAPVDSGVKVIGRASNLSSAAHVAEVYFGSVSKSAPNVTVTSASGPHTPARLLGLEIVSSPSDPTSVMSANLATHVAVHNNIDDSGSAITLAGVADVDAWERQCPGCVRTVQPLDSSTRRIKGIGPNAFNLVVRWVSFTLRIGGALVHFTDVPVLNGHSGLLLGNDFADSCRVVRDNAPYLTPQGIPADGFLLLRDTVDLSAISEPIPFVHRVDTARAAAVALASHSMCSEASAFGPVSASASTPDTLDARIESTVPTAFAPEPIRIPAWSEQVVRVRVPKAALEGHDLAVLPLEDSRLGDLGVLLAPCLARPDADGYIPVRLINPSTRPISIPVLTPVARFIVDPSIAGADCEFTVDEILERINIEEDATEADREHIRQMVSPRRRLFATTLGWAHGYKYQIRTPLIDQGKAVPPSFQQRKRSPEELSALEASIKKQLKLGLIEPVISPYGATPMLIKKPGSSEYRVVLDYRALNALCEPDTYPLPNVETNLSALGNAKLFSTADLLMGFHQIELTDDSIIKTALNTPFGQFAYRRLPMGLTSAPGAFMRLVDASLRGLPPGIALCYVDDLIIFTDGDMAQHMKDVGLVFDKLIESGLTVKCEKVHVGKHEVPYLGFLAGAYGTRPDPKKTQPILDIALSQIQADPAAAARYVGMLGHYRRFLNNLHVTLKDFHNLKAVASNTREIVTSLKFAAAFTHTKHQLANVTALTRPDYSKPFYVDVDSSSSNGVGAILTQRADESDPTSHRILAVFSRRFNELERRYGVRDQECLGLHDALVEWRSYVSGARLIVRTDHRSLRWLLSTQHPDGSRVSGWALKIQGFSPEILWVPGAEHGAADFFSRPPNGGEETGGDAPDVLDRIHDELSNDEPLPRAFSAAAVDSDGEDPSDHRRAAKRTASLHVQKQSDGSLHVLTERQGETLGLVSTTVNRDSKLTYREQLGYHILSTYGDTTVLSRRMPSALTSSLFKASKHHRIHHNNGSTYAETHFFSAYLPENFAVDNAHARNHYLLRMEPISDMLLRRLSHSDDFAFVLSFQRAYLKALDNHKRIWTWLNFKPLFTLLDVAPLTSSSPSATALTASLTVAEFGPRPVAKLIVRSRGLILYFLRRKQEEGLDVPGGMAEKVDTDSRWETPAETLVREILEELRGAPAWFHAQVQHLAASHTRGHENVLVPHHGEHLFFWCLDVTSHALPADVLSWIDPQYYEWVPHSVVMKPSPELQPFPTESENKGKYLEVVRRVAEWNPSPFLSLDPGSSHLNRVPTLLESPYGPAFIQNEIDWQAATDQLFSRLHNHPELTMAVDLEGQLGGPHSHISLLQVCIDAPPNSTSQQQLVYVFDTHVNRRGLSRNHPDSLRTLLESSSIRKVLHCCYGDASALYHEYGIHLDCILDTGIADSLLTGRHWNSPRNLGVVTQAHLGDSAPMQLKGVLQMSPGLFNPRPLSSELFLYAYEDVLHCNRLYLSLHSSLQKRGLLELSFELSKLRCPPRALPPTNPRYLPPHKVAIALLDGSSVVCLQNKVDGSFSLPTGDIPAVNSVDCLVKQNYRRLAGEMWCQRMGTPPRYVRQAVNAKLHKGVRIDDTLLFTADVHHLDGTLFESLQASLMGTSTGAEYRIAIRDRVDYENPAAGVSEGHVSLFQYLHVDAEHTLSRTASGAISISLLGIEHCARAHVCARLTKSGVVETRVSFSVFAVPSPSPGALDTTPTTCIAEVNVASKSSPRSDKLLRAALILHDGILAYTLHGTSRKQNIPLHFPSHPIEQGCEPGLSALKGFDILAGCSLRRGADPSLQDTHSMMPKFSRCLRDATENLHVVGTHGNTLYFACKVPLCFSKYESHFYAARGEGAGFEQTDTNRQRHCGFRLVPITGVIDFPSYELDRYDKQALQAYLKQITVQSSQDDSALSSAFTVDSLDQFDSDVRREYDSQLQVTCSFSAALLAAQRVEPSIDDGLFQHNEPLVSSPAPTSECLSLADQSQHNELPAMGADPVFDALFEARVLLSFSTLESRLEACTAAAMEGRLPQDNDSDAVGPPKYHSPSRADIVQEQRAHPLFSKFVDYLLHPKLSTALDGLDSKDRAGFLQSLEQLHLASDGLLMRRSDKSPKAPSRIVLPAKFHSYAFTAYHDRHGHLGLSKCCPLLLERFYWASDRQMRADLGNHIAKCRVCAQSKISHHSAGEMQIGFSGDHPMDVLSVDTFTPGVTSELVPGSAPVMGESSIPKEVLKEGVAATSNPRAKNRFGYDRTVDWVCHFSKYVVSSPSIGDPSSEEIAYILVREIIRHYGTPRMVRSDRGSAYISSALRALYKRYGIRVSASSSYHHQSVAVVERWHATLKQLLRSQRIASKDDQWHLHLPLLELAFNTTVNAVTGYSPFFLQYLRHAVLPTDMLNTDPLPDSGKDGSKIPEWVMDHLQRLRVAYDSTNSSLHANSLHQKKKYDLRRDVNASFSPGDRVLLIKGRYVDKKLAKAENPTQGPYTVESRLPRDRYVLTDLHTRRLHNVVHVSRLLLYPNRAAAQPATDSARFPIQSIVGRRVTTAVDRDLGSPAGVPRLEYKVKWIGNWPPTWRSIEFLDNVQEMVAAHNRQQNAKGNPLPLEHQSLLPPLLQNETDRPLPLPDPKAVKFGHFRSPAHPPPPPITAPSPAASAPLALPPPRQDLDYLGDPLQPAPAAPLLLPPVSEQKPSSTSSSPHPSSTPVTSLPMATAPQPLDLSDKFPVGSRVDCFHPYEKQTWRGTVVKSSIYQPRASAERAERRIVVVLDDPAYAGEEFVYGLNPERAVSISAVNERTRMRPNSSSVPEAEQPPDGVAQDPATLKAAKRRARVLKQLGIGMASSATGVPVADVCVVDQSPHESQSGHVTDTLMSWVSSRARPARPAFSTLASSSPPPPPLHLAPPSCPPSPPDSDTTDSEEDAPPPTVVGTLSNLTASELDVQGYEQGTVLEVQPPPHASSTASPSQREEETLPKTAFFYDGSPPSFTSMYTEATERLEFAFKALQRARAALGQGQGSEALYAEVTLADLWWARCSSEVSSRYRDLQNHLFSSSTRAESVTLPSTSHTAGPSQTEPSTSAPTVLPTVDSVSPSEPGPSSSSAIDTCPVCFATVDVYHLYCCAQPICEGCLKTWISTTGYADPPTTGAYVPLKKPSCPLCRCPLKAISMRRVFSDYS